MDRIRLNRKHFETEKINNLTVRDVIRSEIEMYVTLVFL